MQPCRCAVLDVRGVAGKHADAQPDAEVTSASSNVAEGPRRPVDA
jgi:hypothetical protein